jgi:hypothetical protein
LWHTTGVEEKCGWKSNEWSVGKSKRERKTSQEHKEIYVEEEVRKRGRVTIRRSNVLTAKRGGRLFPIRRST